jgi:hypothetical protein
MSSSDSGCSPPIFCNEGKMGDGQSSSDEEELKKDAMKNVNLK